MPSHSRRVSMYAAASSRPASMLMNSAPMIVPAGLSRWRKPNTKDETTSEIQLPSHSSTMRNSTPRNSSSSRNPELRAIATAGSMKETGFSPSMRKSPSAISTSTHIVYRPAPTSRPTPSSRPAGARANSVTARASTQRTKPT